MPLLLMIYFYYGMLIRLYRQARAVRQALTGRRKSGEDKVRLRDLENHYASKNKYSECYKIYLCIIRPR